MKTRWDSQCSACGDTIPKGTDVTYDPVARSVAHRDCGDTQQPDFRLTPPKTYPSSEDLSVKLGFLPAGSLRP